MKRYYLLDALRGITLISMIMYHGIWDLVYLFAVDWGWYSSSIGYVWQQSICWTFILLSGFCWSFGRNHWKRGAIVFVAGLIVTMATLIFSPGQRVIFGVLTLHGSCILILKILEKVMQKIPTKFGLGISVFLFVLTRNINDGYLGFEGINLVKLPEWLYQNLFTTYFGFTDPTFYSTDYFSIFPWLFLFLTGYFLYRFVNEKDWLDYLVKVRIPVLEAIGKHTLIIYMLHQPILYFVFSVLFGK